MRQTPARTTFRRTFGPIALGLVVVTVAIIGTLVYRAASTSAAPFGVGHPPGALRAVRPSAPPPSSGNVRRGGHGGATTEHDGSVTEADGVLPGGVTIFDDEHPGVANLAPDLLRALREAAKDAGDEGIELDVNSGWRSPAYQDLLRREAVARYGSEKEAARWVATTDTSAHVSGDAVDIGPSGAAAWLSEHGAGYGLCQVYRNEPWHFELRPKAINRACPAMHADSAHGPSQQR